MPEVSTLPPRTALVSAGADGLGRVIARALLAEGAQVHVFDRSAEAVAAFLKENPGASATVADISSPMDVKRVFADLKARYGRLDLLVNNAGIAGPVGLVEDNDVGEWDRCIGVNLSGMFYVTRLAVPLLKAAGAVRAEQLQEIAVRFTAPVYPGETLRFECWHQGGGEWRLRAHVDARGAVVLNNGLARV
jgi:NAD(P)-dependent dehydrogenase (short-subunit alcohol dehydrogenase family)